MWRVSSQEISMTEGDFGVALPFTVNDITLAQNDEIKITIKFKPNGDPVVEKTFSNIQQNTVNLELTEEESGSLPVGNFIYTLDWYQDGVFMCNIIEKAPFKVVDKA